MSKQFTVLMNKIKEVDGLLAQIQELKIELRLKLASKGWEEWEKTKLRAEKLEKSISDTVEEVKRQLPVVENNPRYQSISDGQLKIDTAFDSFLKSKILPDRYFRVRGIDLPGLIAKLDNVQVEGAELASLYKTVLPIGARLGTGKRRKSEKEAQERERLERLEKNIQALKTKIDSLLGQSFQEVVGNESRIITPAVFSDWQKYWTGKYVAVLKMHEYQSPEEILPALQRLLDALLVSSGMVQHYIALQEKELSQIKYWLDYLLKTAEIDRRRVDEETLDSLRREAEVIVSAYKDVPKFWSRGDLDIDIVDRASSFLNSSYDTFVYTVGSAVKSINWGWYPGYNDESEKPFLSYENDDNLMEGTIVNKRKPGL